MPGEVAAVRGGALRRKCRARIEALGTPDPWDFEEFCSRVAAYTGRALRVMQIPTLPDGLCGMYVSTAATDYVYTTMRSTAFHREHIALHEIGHLLAGHRSALGVQNLASLLLPDLDPAMVRAVLKRTSYTSEQEREAEYFATLVAQRSRPGRGRVAAADPVVATVLSRLENTWGYRSGLPHCGRVSPALAVGPSTGRASGTPSR
jgi:hypothetical protein